METTKQWLINKLIEVGMFESHAEEVLKRAIPKIEESSENITWDSPADGYPDVVLATFWVTVKTEALEWIDDNLPQAWYKAMLQ